MKGARSIGEEQKVETLPESDVFGEFQVGSAELAPVRSARQLHHGFLSPSPPHFSSYNLHLKLQASSNGSDGMEL